MTFPLTPTVIVLGMTAADSRTSTVLSINLSNLERHAFPPRRLKPSPRITHDRQSGAPTNCLPFTRSNPAPTSTANKPSPLSP
jgi:hypothetical protein